MQLNHVFLPAVLATMLQTATPAYAGNEHHGGSPNSETPTTVNQGGGAEVEVSADNTFSPEVANELSNWIKNNQSQYNGGNEVEISGLSPEANAAVKNWVNSQGGSVEQEFGAGSFSPSSMSSLEADVSNAVSNTNINTNANSNETSVDARDQSVRTTTVDARGGAATNTPNSFLQSASFATQTCKSRFGIGLSGGDVFGHYAGLNFSYHPSIGVLIEDEDTGAIYSALEIGMTAPLERGRIMDGMSDGKKELAMCVGTVYVAELEKEKLLHAHRIALETHLHNLQRLSNEPGERTGASTAEHIAVHTYTGAVKPEYERAFRCALTAYAAAGGTGAINQQDAPTPAQSLMAMYGIKPKTSTQEFEAGTPIAGCGEMLPAAEPNQ